MLPSGATLYISLDPNDPTRLTGDQIIPFKLSPKHAGERVPSLANLAPDYLFDARFVAHDHFTLVAFPRSRASGRDNRPRRASRPMEAVPSLNLVRARPAPFTETTAPAPPTEDSTLFASGHMDTTRGVAAHVVALYPRAESGEHVNTPRLATLTYDHPGSENADWAIHFEATVDGSAIRVTADVGKSVGEFHKIESHIRTNERVRSVFWRMFFAIYSQLDSTYAVERAQKNVLTAVLDTYT
jgi:hypothetical protein